MTAHHDSPSAPAANRGTPGDRITEAYVNEGMALVGEGVPAAQVEEASARIGMPVGPLALLDEMSLKQADEALHRELAELEQAAHRATGHEHDHEHGDDHVHEHGHSHGHNHSHDHDHDHGHQHAHARSGTRTDQSHRHVHQVKSRRMPESAVYVLEKMAHGFRRTGRAQGAGFYEYAPDEPKALWSGLKTFERGGSSIAPQDVEDRLLYAQALEVVRCLEEQSDALEQGMDSAVQLINQVGVANFAARAHELADRYGERFRPPQRLIEKASRGESF